MRRLTRYRQATRERLWYHHNKRLHSDFYEPNAGRAPDREVFASLVEDGAAIVPDFLSVDLVKQIVEEVREDVEAVADGRYDGPLRTMRGDEDALCRIYEIEKSLSPSSRAFFESSFISATADALCRDGMHSADSYLDYKDQVGAWDKSLAYHIDSWKVRFKAFLLLEDVTNDQGPFVYLKGSHRNERWRRRWDWGYQHQDKSRSILSPREVAKICHRYDYEEQVFMGKAGDLILANTRGLHRGTVLKSGYRLQLVNVFVMNGPSDYAC